MRYGTRQFTSCMLFYKAGTLLLTYPYQRNLKLVPYFKNTKYKTLLHPPFCHRLAQHPTYHKNTIQHCYSTKMVHFNTIISTQTHIHIHAPYTHNHNQPQPRQLQIIPGQNQIGLILIYVIRHPHLGSQNKATSCCSKH